MLVCTLFGIFDYMSTYCMFSAIKLMTEELQFELLNDLCCSFLLCISAYCLKSWIFMNFQTVWFQWWEITDGWENWLRHEWSWFSSPDYPGLILMSILCIIVNLIVFSVRRSILSSDYYIISLQYTACWLFIFIPAAVSLRNILKAGMLAFIRIKMMYFVSSEENFCPFVAMFMFAKSVCIATV